ncbi:hypothetical protein I79_021021 [Cricetulus griseus]|uniref:Uncharacterized protein n=1 Tax=Cricetulus griseus TaxID=10029 RepID=G3IBJ7_CRIGR|nr:hypothetical protein I79_021021 [Cricetulus griseus]
MGSLWKNKKNYKLPSYSFWAVTYMRTGKARLYNYKWLLNDRVVWHLRMKDEFFS